MIARLLRRLGNVPEHFKLKPAKIETTALAIFLCMFGGTFRTCAQAKHFLLEGALRISLERQSSQRKGFQLGLGASLGPFLPHP